MNVFANPANYGPNPYFMWNPLVGTLIDNNLKAPTTTEIQVGATHSYETENFGRGYISLTYVNRAMRDLFDYRTGSDGQVYDDDTAAWYWNTKWINSPVGKRDYESLELAAAAQYGNWNVSGNIAWSTLKGNYVGEGSNQPLNGVGLDFFRYFEGEEMFKLSETDPYGLLPHPCVYARLIYVNDWTTRKFGQLCQMLSYLL